MTDAQTDREEVLFGVYARVVAAKAGYTTASLLLDRDGVDLHIHADSASHRSPVGEDVGSLHLRHYCKKCGNRWGFWFWKMNLRS